jgi:hypothetical protein
VGWEKSGFVVTALVLASANQSFAQTPARPVGKCEQARTDSRAVFLGDRQYPFAGVGTDEAYGLSGSDCRVITFYRLFDPPPPQTKEERLNRVPRPPADKTPRFIARLVTGDINRPDWLVSTRWADGDTCPGLESALEKLSGVVALKFTGEGPGDVLEVTTDGVGYDLWARGPLYPSPKADYRFDLQMKSNVGTPLAEWIEATEKALAACWTDTPPELK